MTARPISAPLDRYTDIGALGAKTQYAIRKTIMPFSVVLAAETMLLFFQGRPGAAAFLLISLGTCIALKAWSTEALGLPLLPLMVVQSLVIYGVPIAASHEIILTYPASFVFDAGVEVLIFNLAMIMAWKLGMRMFRPASPMCYVLQDFSNAGVKGLSRLGFGMIAAAT